QELLLDIEVAANPAQPLGSASLETFGDLVAGFVDTAEHPTLGGFLGWLTEAEQRDRLSPRQDDPEPGAVQVLSIHGSKGLEWDVVAIPRLVEDELPSKPRSGRGWLAFGMLPDEFRGDRDEIPELVWRGVQSQAEFDESVRAYSAENRERHAEEERRLAYVGVTRARSELLLTGSWWATQKAPRSPSTFLRELVMAGVVDSAVLPSAPGEAENPRTAEASRITWPLDPLGVRRPAIIRAADAVREAAAGPSGAGIGPALADDIRMLLEERRRRGERPDGAVPTRVSASRFKDYVDDPDAVAAELARPMPQRPYRATRIGTLFHAWVEQRSTGGPGAGGGVPVDATSADLDALDLAFDPADELVVHGADRDGDPVEARLERLRSTFAASEWADRRPVAVELELHLPLDEHVFVCKLDAVYEVAPDSEAGRRGIRYQVVDWKTGAAPRDARELELRQTQLALYRLAYARWAGVSADAIDAVFYYVEDDRVLRPDVLYDEEEIRRAWAGVATRPVEPASAPAALLPETVRSAIAEPSAVRPRASPLAGGSAASPQSLRSSGIGAVASIGGAPGGSPAAPEPVPPSPSPPAPSRWRRSSSTSKLSVSMVDPVSRPTTSRGVSSSSRSTSATARIGPVSVVSGSDDRSCTLATSPSSRATASSITASSCVSTPCSNQRASSSSA
ncbi:MAG TPA: 3'-5' exonuclease, partial [Agromyces sp.]|nr:3'-5' exonuclease [Agromyces sp.]